MLLSFFYTSQPQKVSPGYETRNITLQRDVLYKHLKAMMKADYPGLYSMLVFPSIYFRLYLNCESRQPLMVRSAFRS